MDITNWLEDFLFKLKQNGVIQNLLQLIKRFLGDKAQKVTLNGKTSDWACIQADVPQGSIYGASFFPDLHKWFSKVT